MGSRPSWHVGMLLCGALLCLSGCGSGPAAKKGQDFFTSGSREADQRASQRMAKAEQLSGSAEGAGEKKAPKSDVAKGGSLGPGETEGKLSLFERLGGQAGLTAIVEDFTSRALQDPRVNWERHGIKTGFVFHRHQPIAWKTTPQNVTQLKKHMVEFLALATGGPAHYEGKEIKPAHAGMQISNPEFDAAVGDLKASLDKLHIGNKEQKELLAIIESTRPQIVEER